MDQDGQQAGLSHQLRALQDEAMQLTERLQRVLQDQSVVSEAQEDGPALVKHWEQIETIVAALRVCLTILEEDDPESLKSLCRQLRRWRRLEGAPEIGWIEVRYVKGYGPYVYYRRRGSEREIHTVYYGRMDLVQKRLVQELWGDENA